MRCKYLKFNLKKKTWPCTCLLNPVREFHQYFTKSGTWHRFLNDANTSNLDKLKKRGGGIDNLQNPNSGGDGVGWWCFNTAHKRGGSRLFKIHFLTCKFKKNILYTRSIVFDSKIIFWQQIFGRCFICFKFIFSKICFFLQVPGTNNSS